MVIAAVSETINYWSPTTELQRRFFDIITGAVEDEHGWLTPVEEPKAAAQTEPQLA